MGFFRVVFLISTALGARLAWYNLFANTGEDSSPISHTTMDDPVYYTTNKYMTEYKLMDSLFGTSTAPIEVAATQVGDDDTETLFGDACRILLALQPQPL